MDWKLHAHACKEQFLADLIQLLSIPSVEDPTTAKPGQPFGRSIDQALKFMLQRAQTDGFVTRDLEGFVGIVKYGQGDTPVGVLAHLDVVPAGDGWMTPPFSPVLQDGKIFARGAIDDKGPALAAYYALKLLRDSKLPLRQPIHLILGTDEESGWLCMKQFKKTEQIPQTGFSPDAKFPVVNAEKGQIHATLTLPTGNKPNNLSIVPEQPVATLTNSVSLSPSNSEITPQSITTFPQTDGKPTGTFRETEPWCLCSFHSGERSNMVPNLATAEVLFPSKFASQPLFEDISTLYQRYLEEHGIHGEVEVLSSMLGNPNAHGLRFTLHGKAAHAMEPFAGINAGLHLGRFLRVLPFRGRGAEFLHVVAEVLFDDPYGEKLGMACHDEISGPLTVNAGIFDYSQTGTAAIQLNVRFPASLSADTCTQALKTTARSIGWTINDLRTSPGHWVPDDHPTVRTLQRVYEEQIGQPATLLSSGGATYARSLPYGVAFGAVFPGKPMTAHQANEFVEVQDLLDAISIYAQALYELTR